MKSGTFAVLAGTCLCYLLSTALGKTLRAGGSIDFDHLRSSVIRIQAVSSSFNWLTPFAPGDDGVGVGTGFVVQVEPYPLFVTNEHVVNDAKQVRLQLLLFGEQQWDADVVSVCSKFDLAMLVLRKPEEFKKAMTARNITLEKLEISSVPAPMGSDVVALGFPLGQDALKISKGNIAGNEEVYGNICIQSTAPISPGNSGGPLMNSDGSQVVGVNFAKATRGENINYVIPAWRVQQMINKHKNDQPSIPKDGKWKRIQVQVPRFELTAVEANDALYEMSDGCDKGIYSAKIGNRSLFRHAKPAVSEGSFLVSVNGFELDRFGMGLNPKFSADRVLYKDLFFMVPELSSGVTFETCFKGKTTKHSMSMNWDADYSRGLQYIAEPNLVGTGGEFEIFADMTITPMTVNLIRTLVSNGNVGLARWLHPDFVSEPRLVISHISSGGYTSRILPVGAAIAKINGKEVRTLEEFRQHFQPKDRDVWTLETDMGKTIALMFKKTISEQVSKASNLYAPYLLTPGVLHAAEMFGLVEKKKKQALVSANFPTLSHTTNLPVRAAGPIEVEKLSEDKIGFGDNHFMTLNA